jgi:hypothetical protein
MRTVLSVLIAGALLLGTNAFAADKKAAAADKDTAKSSDTKKSSKKKAKKSADHNAPAAATK